MPENNRATELRIRGYLANHGGSVQDAGGRGLTDDMARELGVDKPASLSAVLLEMERDGVITREMRGLRTYKIALVDTANAGAAPAGHRISLRESRAAESAATAASSGTGESGGETATTVVRLRGAPSRPAAKVGSPTAPARAVPPPPPPPPLPPRPATTRVAPPDPPPPAAAPPLAAAPPPAPAAPRARSLRDAIAASRETSPPPPPAAESIEADAPPEYQPQAYQPPMDGQFTTWADLTRGTPAPEGERPDDAPSPPSWRAEETATPSRARPQLSIPVPDVTRPPSNTIMIAVGVAVAGLVLVAVITTVFLKGTTHQVVNQGSSSVDSCNVVTPALATVAFGDDAGQPNYVLGTCVYDDGTHELIVEVYRTDAQQLFNAADSATAQTVPNLGSSAFYDNGELRVLQGTAMLEITLGPVPASAPAPSLLAATRLAVVRLTSG